MITFPNAKINLGLFIERKRPDGYHDISTIFYPIPLVDAVEIIPAPETELFLYGNPVDCPPEKNLVVKAYRLMAEEFHLPNAAIHLYKHIPDGAGLGGGSADAAFLLKMLNEMHALGLDEEELAKRAVALGADCPFFIYNRPMIARGIGNIFSPAQVSLKGSTIVVIKPEISIPTALAYTGTTPKIPENDIADIVALDPHEWKHALSNDFEASIFPKFPELEEIKKSLYASGAYYASMSGSGSAIFGLYDNDNMAGQFAARCAHKRLFKLKL